MDQISFDAILRTDFPSFLAKCFETVSGGAMLSPNWHHQAIAWELARIEQGEETRLIVTMPPRYLKSITISVAWVAWMLGHHPEKRFVCVSYAADLSLKHARDCRAILQSDWYLRLFPKTRIAKGRAAEMDFSTTAGGGRLSTSVGGTLTGRGGDIIVIDDPIKPDEAASETARKTVKDWYANTLVSRLNNKSEGAIVLVMQRVHEDDLTGHLLEAGGWQHLSLPAIAEQAEEIPIGEGRVQHREIGEALHPEREPLVQLEHQKAQMGSAVFSAQYQQAPIPTEGALFKRAWLRHYDRAPERTPGDQIVQSWDTASKDGAFSDWSVCVTALLRKNEYTILDVLRRKLDFPALRRTVISHAEQHKTDVLLIEDAASGQQLIQQLKHDAPPGVPRPIAIKPEGDKISRASGVSAKIEAGGLLLPKDAPWLDLFERELLGFPNARHDDQVDALTQLLSWRKPPSRSHSGPGMILIDANGAVYC